VEKKGNTVFVGGSGCLKVTAPREKRFVQTKGGKALGGGGTLKPVTSTKGNVNPKHLVAVKGGG